MASAEMPSSITYCLESNAMISKLNVTALSPISHKLIEIAVRRKAFNVLCFDFPLLRHLSLSLYPKNEHFYLFVI